MSATIERSPGLSTGLGFVAGGGYSGSTKELDALVQEGAEALASAYDLPVTMRFNSDRRSGGAWLKTHAIDGFGANAEIGIGAQLTTPESVERVKRLYPDWEDYPEPGLRVYAHIGRAALRSPEFANESGYVHNLMPDVATALAFVREHGSLDHLRES